MKSSLDELIFHQINMHGMDNKHIIHSIGWIEPSIIKNDETRNGICDIQKREYVPYDQKRKTQIDVQIGVARNRLKKFEEETDMLKNPISLVDWSKVGDAEISRIATGTEDWDYIFDGDETSKGMPRCNLTIFAGEPGVGKTRILIYIVSKLLQKDYKVLFFQNEASPRQFKGWVKNCFDVENSYFGLSSTSDLADQLSLIEDFKPDLVIVDSLQMITQTGMRNGLKEVTSKYKEKMEKMNAHTIFVGQLNKQGEIAGSKNLQHLVDICLKAERIHDQTISPSSPMSVSISCSKNREGSVSYVGKFFHKPDGVHPFIRNKKSI